MDETLFLKIINIGSFAIVLFSVVILAFTFYYFLFKGGYQRFYNVEKNNEKLKNDIDEVKSSPPIGDWGG